MEKNELNQIYARLNQRRAELMTAFGRLPLPSDWNWYSGHYNKNEAGEYEMDEYPIPVISIKGLCDVEISLDSVTITTKQERISVLKDPMPQFSGIDYEVYGVENYLTDYYAKDISMEDFQERIRKSQEKELGFTFLFDFNVNTAALSGFVEMLQRKGFYY